MGFFKERKPRSFEEVKNEDEVIALLKDDFRDKKLHIKFSLERREVTVNEFMDDRSIMVVTDPDYEPEEKFTIYGLLDKYFEIDLKVEEVRGPGYLHCSILRFRKALRGRRDLRFRMSAEKVAATNFKLSKHTIEISDFKIPTGIKVIIEQFQSQQQKLGDIVKVDVFSGGDAILDHVKKTGKNVLVEDAANPASYRPVNDDFIDLVSLLDDEFDQYVKKNIERGYKSLVAVPVVYITESGGSIPFAYIQVISKSGPFSLDDVLEIKELSINLVSRIRDANTLLVPVHQDILEISMGGARIMLTDENLKKYVMHTRGFIFDIVFKLQAPITIYGEIRHMYTNGAGNLFVGVDFAGNSSRKDEMKRFYSIMRPMEVDYKSRLLKEMRQKKKSPQA